MRTFVNIIRSITGLVFMFSGFVKGIDPMGFAYRLEDYYNVYHISWLMPLALTFSIALCTVEFVLGVMLLFKLRIRITAVLVLLMMLFFTLLTFYDALTNLVPDCGCFGDAIKLSNWQTFYKNIVLIIFAFIVFIYRRKQDTALPAKRQWSYAFIASVAFIYFSVYCYMHLPLIDFTEWKPGNKLFAENPVPQKYYLTYKNKKTGEKKEYLSPDYPYADSVWMAQWEFVSQRVEDPNIYYGRNLQITDSAGTDYTAQFIRDPGFVFLMTSKDINLAAESKLAGMNGFAEQVVKSGAKFILLVNNTPAQAIQIAKKENLIYPVYFADEIELKTMVRSNPGLLLLHNGVIIKKWHYRDIPDFEDVSARYLNLSNKLGR
ncbi:MAG: BT_3928 family protein [Bacteroidales bacterium]